MINIEEYNYCQGHLKIRLFCLISDFVQLVLSVDNVVLNFVY